MSSRLLLNRSLKTRVTLFTLTIFVLSVWAITFSASLLLQGDMQRLLGEQQFSTVSVIASNVNDRLSDRLRAVNAIAGQIDADLLVHTAMLQTRLDERPILPIMFNAGTFITGADGVAIASLPVSAGRIGISYLDRDFIVAALQEGRTSIGRPVIGKRLKSPVIVIAAPIRDRQGKVIGALAGVTDLSQPNFLDEITENRYGRSGGYLLNAPKERLIVTATDRTRIMQSLPPAGANPMLDRYMQGFEGYGISVNSRGVEELTSAKGIPVAGWFMGVVTPAADAFAPIYTMQRRMMLASLGLTLLAGLLTWWMLKRQLEPLTATAHAMVALSNKNQLPQPLPVSGQDEIGQLTGGFNRLVETWIEREGALRESEQNLAITLNSIGDAVIATDPQGRITNMNPAAERLCEWPLSQASGRSLSEVFCIVNASTREAVADPVQLVMAHERVVELANHTLLLARHGSEHHISDSAAPIRNAGGEIVGVVLVFSDVTEKHRAEEALRRRRDMLERTESMAHLASFEWAVDANIVSWSPEMFRIFGRDPALGIPNLQGQAALYTPQSTQALFDVVGKAVSDGTPYELELMAVLPDGQQRPCIVKGYPERDASGRVVLVAGLVQDITDRKQAENALLRSEERWKFAIDGAGDGLWDWNTQTGEAFYAPRYKQMYGYADADFGTSSDEWSKRIHPDDAPGVFTALQPYIEGKPGAASVEFRMLCKNGSWKWTLGRGMVVSRDADGKPLRMIGTNSDITERKAHQSQLEHVAHFDALTNLPNRVLLADRLQQAMAQALRRAQHLAVVYLDLDGFKAINDQHGHDIGDQVLVALAQRMRLALREGDSLARLGGDEFVIVLIDVDDRVASLPMLTRLKAACAQAVQVGALSLQVSASVGITFYPQAQQDIDADQLLRQADQAMYQAKLAGKNRLHFFDATQDSSIRGRHESVERIRLALEQQEFVLHYQPKVNMRSGRIIGAEALIRWQHPEKGLLLPAMFLPFIEDHPLAVDVGEWVLDTTLTQIERWHAAGLDMRVSVNVGSRQLQQSDFVDRLKFILAKHPLVDPTGLELEVLETSALEDIAQVSDVIEACQRIGVKFALDDFGTGYSSLSYLKLLRVAMLKIDQSFVRDMLEDPDDLAILQGVIGLATAFKRQVIAEGVETVAHGTLLLQLGCELAQGYGIAQPMSAEQMPAWSTAWRPDAAWRDSCQRTTKIRAARRAR